MYALAENTRSKSKRVAWTLAVVMLCSIAATAQYQPIDDLTMKMSGSLGFGYSGAFGDHGFASQRAQGFTMDADLTGFYFHPNFLSFQFRPYYDRNKSNSDSQSITRGTGFGGSLGLFGGSRFPGSISFGKDFSSNSEFRLAGVPTVSGDSSGQNFGITWSALVPEYPTLTASYTVASSSASFMDFASSHASSKNLNLNSGYTFAGFDLHGNLSHITNNFTTPAYLTTDVFTGGGSGTTYNASAQHRLPLKGSIGLGWAHSSYENENGSTWGSTSYTASNAFTPWHRLTFYQSASYTTDLAAAFAQTLLNGQTAESILSTDQDSSGVYYNTGATLTLFRGLSLNGHFNHRIQWLEGQTFEDSQYGGSVNYNYSNRFLGFIYFGLGMVDTASKVGNEGLGFNANVGMNRKFGRWDTSADFNYSQNVQTLLGVATTSSYMYGFSANRKLSDSLRWNGSFRASHSGIEMQEGAENRAESFSSSVMWQRWSLGGSYSQSKGTAIFTSSGELVATPVGGLITNDLVLFNARSFTISASTRLFRRVNVFGGYSRFTTETTRLGGGLFNTGDRYNVRTEYRLRKFSFIGGYNRSMQDVSTISGGPRIVNSYYVSLSRWFNVF